MSQEDLEKGIAKRKKVMGEAFVKKAMSNSNTFTNDLQSWINEHAWGSTWQRDAISDRTRSLCTIAMLTALKAPNELKGHIRGALNNGCTVTEIKEVLLHSVLYCGAPATQEAFRAAVEVLEQEGYDL